MNLTEELLKLRDEEVKLWRKMYLDSQISYRETVLKNEKLHEEIVKLRGKVYDLKLENNKLNNKLDKDE